MTSRERVRVVIAGEIPDWFPNGLGAMFSNGIHVIVYRRFRRLLGLPDRPVRIMSFEGNDLLNLDAMMALEVDLVSRGVKPKPARFLTPGWEGYLRPVTLWDTPDLLPTPRNLFTDPDGTVWMDVPPRDLPDGCLRRIEDSVRWLFENTEPAIVCDETIVDLEVALCGAEVWWMLMTIEPIAVHVYIDKKCKVGLVRIGLLEQAVGRYADLMMIAHDFGDSRGVAEPHSDADCPAQPRVSRRHPRRSR